jgi:hypothetical protein
MSNNSSPTFHVRDLQPGQSLLLILYSANARGQNRSFFHSLQGKSHLCIPLLGSARPQSKLPHLCVCERFICSQDRSTYFPAAEYADGSWKYINLSQIYECRNWETEHYNSVLEISVSFLRTHKWEPDIYIGFSPALQLQCSKQQAKRLHTMFIRNFKCHVQDGVRKWLSWKAALPKWQNFR